MRFLSNKLEEKHYPAGYRLSVVAHSIIWGLLALLVCIKVLLPALKIPEHFGIWIESGNIYIVDGPSFFNFAKAFWLEPRASGISAYSVSNHLNVTSAWLGKESRHSLSFGYSPTMLWILAPLIYYSHAIAFCIFNSIGLLTIWWQTRPVRCRFGLGLLVFLSPLAFGCFQQGQTALLTGAGLLFLAERSRANFAKMVMWQTLIASLVLWALTAKPPLALTAGVVLLGLRQWRPVLLAILFTLMTTLAISPNLGQGWITDYLHLLTTHNRLLADPVFAFSHAPAHMANLRGILSVDLNLPDDFASRFSLFIWLGALFGLVVSGPRLRLGTGEFWSVGVLLYLLFCPHVSSYEVLQIGLLLPFCIPATIKKLHLKHLVLLFIVSLLPFVSPVQTDNRLILFSGMLFLLGNILIQWQEAC